MQSFKREKIKFNISKVSTRKKLLDYLDVAREEGYLNEPWFQKAVLKKEVDLGCNVLDEYLENKQEDIGIDPIKMSDMSSSDEIEMKKRVSKHIARLDVNVLYPDIMVHIRDMERRKLAEEE